MATFNSFEEIEAWQEGRKLIQAIRDICKRDNVKKDFNFVDQISGSARSICANIAEGFESMTVGEFIQFLGYAKRSAGEVRSHLYDAKCDGYVTPSEFHQHREHSLKISRMIAGLIHYLQSIDQTKKRTLKYPKQTNQKP